MTTKSTSLQVEKKNKSKQFLSDCFHTCIGSGELTTGVIVCVPTVTCSWHVHIFPTSHGQFFCPVRKTQLSIIHGTRATSSASRHAAKLYRSLIPSYSFLLLAMNTKRSWPAKRPRWFPVMGIVSDSQKIVIITKQYCGSLSFWKKT